MSELEVIGFFLIGGLFSSIASGFMWVRKRRDSPPSRALMAAALPMCIYVSLAICAIMSIRGENSTWNTARLVPSVALAKGHQVYSTRDEGSVQTTMYPPMWVVSYLPVALGKTPAQVLRIGLVLTLMFSFLPIVLLLREISSDSSLTMIGSTSFLHAALLFASLSYSLFVPHADAPSLGYAMLACWLTLKNGVPGVLRIALVAFLSWCSILSKQVMLPILLALPLWFLFVHGRKDSLRLVAWLAVVGVGLVALMTPFFRMEGVIFNTLSIPIHVPWKAGDNPRILAASLMAAQLLRHAIPAIILVTVGAALSFTVRSSMPGSARNWGSYLAENRWTLPALVAVTMIPTSVIGRAKIGGDINTFSPTMYFLLAAGIVAVLQVPQRFRMLDDYRAYRTSLGLVAFCAIILASGGAALFPSLADNPPIGVHNSQQAYQYLIKEDNRTYFPMHPLAHLLADQSLFHLATAIYDRERLAGFPLSPEQRDAHLPIDLDMVCWDPDFWGETWMRENYFTDLARAVKVESLGPVWKCYAR